MNSIVVPRPGHISQPMIQRSRIIDGFDVSDKLMQLGSYTDVIIREGNRILSHTHNSTVLGGRLALLERSFGVVPDMTNHLTLNSMMGIEHSRTTDVLTNMLARKTAYFMAGDGAASTAVPGKIYEPHNYETKLYHGIPFRLVPVANDLSAADQSQYRLRRVETHNGSDYYAYYAKRFDPGVVFLEYNDATFNPIESDTVPVDEDDASHRLAGGSVLAYNQFTLTIEAVELKEYFNVVKGSLDGASMSEIGLVYGADLPNELDSNKRNELAAAELFAKVTSSAVAMDEEGNQRVVEYRVYAR